MNIKIKKILLSTFLAVFLAMMFFGFYQIAQAQTSDVLGIKPVDQAVALSGTDIRVVITKIINVVLGLLGIIALAIVIYGGFVYMTAGGNEEKVATGKKILINGVIGLVIILSAFSITLFVLNKLGQATGIFTPAHCSNDVWDRDTEENLDCGKECPACSIDPDCPWCVSGFYLDRMPRGGQMCLRNYHPTLYFTQDVDVNTLQNNVQMIRNSDQTVVSGQWVKGDRNNIAVFNPIGNCSFIPGKAGATIPFDLVNSIIVPATTSLNILHESDFSYSFWINETDWDAIDKYELAVSKGGGGYPGIGMYTAFKSLNKVFGFDLRFYSGMTMEQCTPIVNAAGGWNKVTDPVIIDKCGGQITLTTPSFAEGSWHHVVLSVKTNTTTPQTTAELYFDGALVGGPRSINKVIYNLNPIDLQTRLSKYSHFLLDELRVYSRALSKDEVLDLYKTPVNVNGTLANELLLRLTFDDQDVDFNKNLVLDKSGNNLNAVWNGTKDANNDCLLPNTNYTLQIKNEGKDIKATNGDSLKCNMNCTDKRGCCGAVGFTTGAGADRQAPILSTSPFTINNFPIGQQVPFTVQYKDDTGVDNVGFYVDDHFYQSRYLNGCSVSGAVSIDLPTNGMVQGPHLGKAVAIDQSAFTASSTRPFNLVPNQCLEETGGICGGGDGTPCDTNRDCAYSYKCVNEAPAGEPAKKICHAYPLIEGVSPVMNGAENNWLTVYGKNFGEDMGKIEFANGSSWVLADLADCQGQDIWNDKWAIVKIPKDQFLPRDNQGAIRITTNENILENGLETQPSDYTNDNWGALVGDSGLFTKNEIKRPGLCSVGLLEPHLSADGSVVIAAGDNVGMPGDKIKAIGNSLGKEKGKSNLYFGDAGKPVQIKNKSDWADNQIITAVPNLSPGQYWDFANIVSESGDGEKVEISNAVPFQVINERSLLAPIINKIEPFNPTPGSFITIYGSRFGKQDLESKGRVFLASSRAEAQTCAGDNPAESCVQLTDAGFPPQCSETWFDDHVVVGLPKDLFTKKTGQEEAKLLTSSSSLNQLPVIQVSTTVGDLQLRDVLESSEPRQINLVRPYLILEQSSPARILSSGSDQVNVINGAPLPGLCSLTPDKGTAPLPSGELLSLYGNNFSDNPVVYFWTHNAKPNIEQSQASGWLYSSLADGNEKFILENLAEGQKIKTFIPYNSSEGYSMKSGDIVVKNKEGAYSNSLPYAVEDCRQADGATRAKMSGFRCCGIGEDQAETNSDAGKWKPAGYHCSGDSTVGGYVWRFYTGAIPKTLRVVEDCDYQNWEGASQSYFPSPIPWQEWPEGKNVCLNATIGVRFSLGVLPSTLNSSNVGLYKCSDADCSERETVPPEMYSISYNDKTLHIHELPPSGKLTENTWYRVELSNQIKAETTNQELGTVTEISLEPTRSCGPGTSYCYTFKTGGASTWCELIGAGIQPPDYTSNFLGVLQDPGYPFVYGFESLANPPHPYYYEVWGKGSQACSVLNVGGYDWQWTTDNISAATVNKASSTTATVTVLQQTAPGKVIINAGTVVEESSQKKINATSSLIVDLGGLEVLDWWPNCTEGCINGGIGVTFNRFMQVDSYDNNLVLKECLDETCDSFVGTIDLTIDKTDDFSLRAVPAGSNAYLKPNTWYQATIVGGETGVKSLAQLNPVKVGKGLEKDFVWKFKTNDDPSPCKIKKVSVYPDPFSAYFVGQIRRYLSVPYSQPDTCSTKGQELNPWLFGWQWSTGNSEVAEVSHFETGYANNFKSYCSPICLPKGSDIKKGESDTALCGNNYVDQGEDCDIASASETPGVSCGFDCLRPGNTVVKGCGDGFVSVDLGEECDPGKDQYCTNDCHWTGSGQQFDSVNTSTPICGSGLVTAGEECDINDPATKVRCTDRCLHAGTLLSRGWCDSLASGVDYAECANAHSACGNGILEKGEECEKVDSSKLKVWDENQNSVQKNILGGKTADEICNSSCLLENACGALDLPLAETNGNKSIVCTKGEEGCNNSCTLYGSSINYKQPSLCADGIVGTGEYSDCEITRTQLARFSLGENPIQYVTAIGQSLLVDSITGSQTTTIQAKAVAYYDFTANTTTALAEASQASGGAKYNLLCGYKETESGNNCVGNGNNDFGVAANSCCYLRPRRASEYPADATGLGAGEKGVCRNTLITMTFSGEIDEKTLQDNVVLVSGYDDPNYVCASHGQESASGTMNSLFAYGSGEENIGGSVWAKIWLKIKTFFARLLGREALAEMNYGSKIENDLVWCKSGVGLNFAVDQIKNADGGIVSSTVNINIDRMLESTTYYGVLVHGGLAGVKDTKGVGIRGISIDKQDDLWLFKTGEHACRVGDVVVAPEKYLFTKPYTTSTFVAEAKSVAGELIVPIPSVYDWSWSWGPTENSLLDIPAQGTSTVASVIIGSRNVEGTLPVIARLKENTQPNLDPALFDTSASPVKNYGTSNISVDFCAHPWPSREYYPYEDGWTYNEVVNNSGFDVVNKIFDGSALPSPYFNFSMSYCADAGGTLTQEDDLPYLEPHVFTSGWEFSTGTLKKIIFFNDKNEDVIGLQVFKNDARLTARGWYGKRFSNVSVMQSIKVGGKWGYEGITDGNNYYIDFQDISSPGTRFYIKNYILLLSINNNAQSTTREAFNKLLDSLQFNINLSDFHYCGKADKTPDEYLSVSCETDFDCLGVEKVESISEEVAGRCGISEQFSVVPQDLAADFNEVYFVDANNAWAVGDNRSIYHTTNGGQDWIKMSDTELNETAVDHPVPLAHFISVDFLNGNQGIISGGLSTVMSTKDGGQTWKVNQLAVSALKDVDILDANNAWAVGYNKLFQTQDGGDTWQQAREWTSTIDLKAVRAINQDNIWLLGKERLLQVAGGSVYVVPLSQIPTGVTLNDIIFINNNIGLAVGDKATVLRTEDGGKNWTEMPSIKSAVPASANFEDIYTDEDNNWWLSGTNGSLFKSVDNGKNWIYALQPFAGIDLGLSQAEFRGILNKGNSIWIWGINEGVGFALTTARGECHSQTQCVLPNICQGYSPAVVDDHSDSNYCSASKTKIRRDWERLHDIYEIQNKLNSYYHNNFSFPDLLGGTYLPGYTVSRWPSWGVLAQALNSTNLPQDPLNVWYGCDPQADPQTCWNAKDIGNPFFSCPQKMSVYEYQYNTSTKTYALHVPFEYLDEGTAELAFGNEFYFNKDYVTTLPSCQGGSSIGIFADKCGDNIVNANIGEECDPPGTKTLVPSSTPGYFSQWTCDNSCHWQKEPYLQSEECGNGVVDSWEACDDGEALNGTYGHCNNHCDGLYEKSCHNGTKDVDAQNYPLEVCEFSDDTAIKKFFIGASIDGGSFSLVANCPGSNDKFSNDFLGLKAYFLEFFDEAKNKNLLTVVGPISDSQVKFCHVDSKLLYSETGGEVDGKEVVETFPCDIDANCRRCEGYPGACESVRTINILGSDSVINIDENIASADFESLTCGVTTGTFSMSSGASLGGLTSMSIFKQVLQKMDERAGELCFNYVGRCKQGNNLCNTDVDCKNTANSYSPSATYQDALNFLADASHAQITAEGANSCVPIIKEYNLAKENSCAWDCQSYGSYCGDGIVDVGPFSGHPYEQCEIDDDGCDSSCKFDNGQPADPSTTPTAPACGNGKIDAGEKCDEGDKNGVVCSAVYNSSCTYCSADCANILTADGPYCGNGKIDLVYRNSQTNQDTYEICEKDPQTGQILMSTTALINGHVQHIPLPAICLDKGSYVCSNNCLTLSNSCVDCGFSSKGSVPQVKVRNVIWPWEGFGWPSAPQLISPASSDIFLYYINGENYNNILESVDLGSGAVKKETLNIVSFVEKINTNLICNNKTSQRKQGLAQYKLQFAPFDAPAWIQNTLFDYPVSGQTESVVNEYLISPPIWNRGEVRIVLSWTKAENKNFNLLVQNFGLENQLPVSMLDAKALGRLCTAGGLDFTTNYHEYCTENDRVFDGVFVHSPIHFDTEHNLAADAMTIDTSKFSPYTELNDKYVVFVEPIDGEIADYLNSNLKIEIYYPTIVNSPAENYLYQYIYKPDQVIEIKNYQNTGEVNQSARYWYALDLIKGADGKYRASEVNTVETDWQELCRGAYGADSYCGD